ncbi:hypothetical protein HPC49_20020 [Pyxidicoccus fallax]|uniref:Beta-ketoacyl synthase N-terminal domain-containing protein n=1 Tax=Pyxidicoccus fallax TaxID=394095 RepID=A0A848LEL4_9BACT|nr:hypothetical protein [Pyxidicoccus fallax]NMO14691.1 hypothetical protein [Pyxidicoccus fallax]NPC80499.1 hypothetical protein [Pyxidicoccus fallax]
MAMNSTRTVITGMGAVTSVGPSASPACAAILAGISRPRQVTWFKVLDEEAHALVPLVGHPIQGYTEGFVGEGRWLRLALGCVLDLLEHPEVPTSSDREFWERTGLLVATPCPLGEQRALEFPSGLELARKLRSAARLPLDERGLGTVSFGHTGAAAAIQRGLELLASSRLERLLIVAADSYLDLDVLEELADGRRLKTDEAPLGLMPGEAGACFLLELEASARRRKATALATVSGVATGREANHRQARGQNTGTGLAHCVREALAPTHASSRFEGTCFLDLNGEHWRANEWGCARVRLTDLLGEPELRYPCTYVGDTGAASGAVGVCLALHALTRGFAARGEALVLSSSEQGEVGSILLGASTPMRTPISSKG